MRKISRRRVSPRRAVVLPSRHTPNHTEQLRRWASVRGTSASAARLIGPCSPSDKFAPEHRLRRGNQVELPERFRATAAPHDINHHQEQRNRVHKEARDHGVEPAAPSAKRAALCPSLLIAGPPRLNLWQSDATAI